MFYLWKLLLLGFFSGYLNIFVSTLKSLGVLNKDTLAGRLFVDMLAKFFEYQDLLLTSSKIFFFMNVYFIKTCCNIEN